MSSFCLIQTVDFAAPAVLLGLLAWLSLIDIRERRLPNKLVLAVAILGLTFSAWQCLSVSSLLPLKAALWGVPLTAGPAVLFSLLYYLLRKHEGFGMGDLKLLAALGLYLGPVGLMVLPLASVMAVLGTLPQFIFQKEKTRGQTIAFGPYITLATLFLVIFL